MSSRDLFGAEEIEAEAVPEGKKQLVERKRLIAQLITSTVLKYNVNARTNTALFWFWYENMVPEHLRLNTSHMGMVIKDWKNSQQKQNENQLQNGTQKRSKKGNDKFFKTVNYEKTWEGIEGPIFQFGEVRNENEVVYSNEHNRLCALIGRKTLNLDETLFMELFNETKKQKPKQSNSRDLVYEEQETDNSFEYIISLPGTIKLDFSFEEKKNSLLIEGERHLENAPFSSKSFWTGPFQKKIKLSPLADETKVSYSCEEGFLYLHIPKRDGIKKILSLQSTKAPNSVTSINVLPIEDSQYQEYPIEYQTESNVEYENENQIETGNENGNENGNHRHPEHNQNQNQNPNENYIGNENQTMDRSDLSIPVKE